MKNAIYLILATIFFVSCATSKKTTTNKETVTKSEKTTEKTKDSTSTTKKSEPTEGAMEFSLQDLQSMMGDFVQNIKSGDGNESKIEKRGDRLFITVKNAGSTEKETKVKSDSKETIYDSKFILSESSKVIERIPLKYWIIFWIVIIIWFRKFISQILVAIFPGLGAFRLFALFVGKNQN